MSKEEIRNRRVGTLNSSDKFAEVQAEAERITRKFTAGGESTPTPSEEIEAEPVQDVKRFTDRVTLPPSQIQYSKPLVGAIFAAYQDFLGRGVEPSTAKELVSAYASVEAAASIAKALSQVGK